MSRKTILAFEPGIAGVDEAGRGPLAGPVLVAAVLIPDGYDTSYLGDSKQLSPAQRQLAEVRIKADLDYAIVAVNAAQIDALNILNATLAGMQQALEQLRPAPKAAIIDGNRVPPLAPVPCSAIVKADATYAAVAAASILAKVERDRQMLAYHEQYPHYRFDKNFGYPTPEHLELLRTHGPCPIHRTSYEPVRQLLRQPCLALVD